jgi:protein-tyrosine phosphatase
MEKLFWLLPGKLAGRPGPDREPWNVDALYRAGIRAVLSVNDGRLVHAEDFTEQGMEYACVPLSDNAPPRIGDDEICRAALLRAYDFIQAQLRRDKPVLVHCTSGKDRTGLVLAYFLMRQAGCDPATAITKVRAVRSIALSAMGWEAFANHLLHSMDNGSRAIHG